MSVLSDDTDVLLLIPPDFFLIPSDSDEEPPRKVAAESLIVSDLITQVNDLEGRICLIENRCLSENAMTGNLQRLRHFGSVDALSHSCRSSFNTRSLQGTPQKGSASLEMRENMLTSSEYVSQRERDDRMLKEIDQFFRQRKTGEDEGSDGGNEELALTKTVDAVTVSTPVFNLKKVNDLLKKLDETQKEIEEKAKLKEIAGVEVDEGLSVDREEEGEKKTPNEKSSPDPVRSVKRALSFDEGRKEGCREKNPSIGNSEFHSGDDSLGSLCRSKQVEEVDKAEGKKSQELSNLLSLSNLWGSTANLFKSNCPAEDEQMLKHRVQEERCRRQHCEEQIQQLQLRLLEEQQKVAVAIKVDREKNEAISKLTEGWNKLVGHWRDLENQRNNLAKKLLSDRERFKAEMSSAYQTVKRYETELSKALDLAHGYKEKCEASEREKKTYRSDALREMENLRGELKSATETLKTEECKREKLEKLLSTKEELVNQGKAKISELQNHIREGRKTLKELQTEMENIKADKEKVSERLREEKGRIAGLEQSRKALQHQNEELKKREKALKDDTRLLTEQLEKVKIELKEFYQEQVESIVQEKLKEFQEQLATAEKTLQGEIEMREKTVTEMAVKQVQQIVEKHLTEMGQLEEKHREECELWKAKLNHREEKIRELQKKLEQHSSSKTILAQRLHSVMEAQWQEALKILSSSPHHGKSPPASARGDAEKPLTRQNTFTMTPSPWDDAHFAKSPATSPSSTAFCREGVLTYREQAQSAEPLTYRVDETPQKMSSADHLKKYIKALLERAPGHPTDDDSLESTNFKCVDSLTDESSLPRWQHILSDASSQAPSDANKCFESVKQSKETKPPWK